MPSEPAARPGSPHPTSRLSGDCRHRDPERIGMAEDSSYLSQVYARRVRAGPSGRPTLRQPTGWSSVVATRLALQPLQQRFCDRRGLFHRAHVAGVLDHLQRRRPADPCRDLLVLAHRRPAVLPAAQHERGHADARQQLRRVRPFEQRADLRGKVCTVLRSNIETIAAISARRASGQGRPSLAPSVAPSRARPAARDREQFVALARLLPPASPAGSAR